MIKSGNATLSSFSGKLEDADNNDTHEKKSFAREIIDKNKQIREVHKEIIQETNDNQPEIPIKNLNKPATDK